MGKKRVKRGHKRRTKEDIPPRWRSLLALMGVGKKDGPIPLRWHVLHALLAGVATAVAVTVTLAILAGVAAILRGSLGTFGTNLTNCCVAGVSLGTVSFLLYLNDSLTRTGDHMGLQVLVLSVGLIALFSCFAWESWSNLFLLDRTYGTRTHLEKTGHRNYNVFFSYKDLQTGKRTKGESKISVTSYPIESIVTVYLVKETGEVDHIVIGRCSPVFEWIALSGSIILAVSALLFPFWYYLRGGRRILLESKGKN